jgi:hypothetical protein
LPLTTGVTGVLPLANGGTNGSTQTTGFNNLSPLTTKGDIIVHNGTNNIRFAKCTDGYSYVADSGQASGLNCAIFSQISSLTANVLPKGVGTTGYTNSSITDNGTTVSTAEPFVSGTDNSVAGSFVASNVAANAHTNWQSAATTSNTIKGFAVVPVTTDVVTCTSSGIICTLTDSGASLSAGVLTLGTDNSVAGTIQTANVAANAHTIWQSGATTTNTIKGFATVPTTTDLLTCTTASTTCTLTDSGIAVTSRGIKPSAVVASGTTFTVSGCGSAGAITGGSFAGSFTVGTGATPCTFVITMNGATGYTAPNGWACHGSDITTGIDLFQSATSTTTCSIKGNASTSDTIVFSATAY